MERDHGTGSRTPYRVRWSDGDSDWLRPEDIVLDEAAAEENRAAAEALAAEERARSDASCDASRANAMHRAALRLAALRLQRFWGKTRLSILLLSIGAGGTSLSDFNYPGGHL